MPKYQISAFQADKLTFAVFMEISVDTAHEVVVSFCWHDFLGHIFETYAVELDPFGEFTLRCQYVSAENAKSFNIKSGFEKVIAWVDSLKPNKIFKRFNTNKNITDSDSFFKKLFNNERDSDAILCENIKKFVSRVRAEILRELKGYHIYEFTKDRYPQKKRFFVDPEPASVLFHFKRNEEGTNYFPTIRHRHQTLVLHKFKNEILSESPAWIWIDDKIIELGNDVNAKKLTPFQKKNHVFVPKKLEGEFFGKFGMTLVESFDVVADGGLTMIDIKSRPSAMLYVREKSFAKQSGLFDTELYPADMYLIFELFFEYDQKKFAVDTTFQLKAHVELIQTIEGYRFEKIHRDIGFEKNVVLLFQSLGMDMLHGKVSKKFNEGCLWLSKNLSQIKKADVCVVQNLTVGEISSFLPTLELNLEEKIDWFELNGVIRIGEHEFNFSHLLNAIKAKEKFLKVNDGTIALIPEEWIEKLEHIIEVCRNERGGIQIKKQHFPLVSGIEESNSLKIKNPNVFRQLSEEEIPENPLPKGFTGELRPYQKKGFDWLVRLYHLGIGGCLADDMGLGKTIQCLALLQNVVNQRPKQASLIIMPTSLIGNWEREIKRFTPKLTYKIYIGGSREKDINLFYDYNLILTTYSTARIDIDILEKIRFAYIILDESQSIKNPASLTTIALKRLSSNRKILLSGTPLQNSTIDLWTQMDFANYGILGTLNSFKNNFLLPIERDGDLAKVQQLSNIIKPLILRRTKEQVAKDLPEKFEEVVYCSMSEAQSKFYDKIKNQVRSELLLSFQEQGTSGRVIRVIEALTKLRQIANHPKLTDENYCEDSGKFDEIMARLESVIEEDHKVLVFSQFTKHLKLFTEKFSKNGVQFCYLDGQTKNRQELVDKFQQDPELKVFFISLKAGGVGLNITAADYVFVLDPWWNPAAEAQAIDRAHRIGQSKNVFVYHFISQDTVEDKIRSLQERKKKLANAFVQVGDRFVKALTENEIEQLFE